MRSNYQDLMKAQTVRPAYGTHPRLAILGQLEARLIEADMIILAGLMKTWPPDPGHDPWMSQLMQRNLIARAGTADRFIPVISRKGFAPMRMSS